MRKQSGMVSEDMLDRLRRQVPGIAEGGGGPTVSSAPVRNETTAGSKALISALSSQRRMIDDRQGAFPYAKAREVLEGVEYDLKSLSMFVEIGELHEADGEFLSAAINKVIQEGDTFTIRPPSMMEYLGFRLPRGKLVIEGGAGNCLGAELAGGTIVLKGSCGLMAGQAMAAGELRIEKDAADMIGADMKGGTITVGSVEGNDPCRRMQGGTVVITGNLWNIAKVGRDSIGGTIRLATGEVHNVSPSCKAEVYLNGKLLNGYLWRAKNRFRNH